MSFTVVLHPRPTPKFRVDLCKVWDCPRYVYGLNRIVNPDQCDLGASTSHTDVHHVDLRH